MTSKGQQFCANPILSNQKAPGKVLAFAKRAFSLLVKGEGHEFIVYVSISYRNTRLNVAMFVTWSEL